MDFTLDPYIEVVREHPDAIFPSRAYACDSGWDLHAIATFVIPAHVTRVIGAGLSLRLPPGFEAQVRPRSSLSSKGIWVAFGTIDNGYTGEIGCTVTNTTVESVTIEKGQKIAQLVPVRLANYAMDGNCNDSIKFRGIGGFGSSDKNESKNI